MTKILEIILAFLKLTVLTVTSAAFIGLFVFIILKVVNALSMITFGHMP